MAENLSHEEAGDVIQGKCNYCPMGLLLQTQVQRLKLKISIK
jgi:hypothetical protein